MSAKWMIVAGALLAAAGVAKGAYGAHGLENQLQQAGYAADLGKRLAWFDTAVRYQLLHALGLVAVGALAGRVAPGLASAAAVAFIVGIALFSGSLFVMTFAGEAWRKLGMITPLGGLAFILGWLMLAVAAWRHP